MKYFANFKLNWFNELVAINSLTKQFPPIYLSGVYIECCHWWQGFLPA